MAKKKSKRARLLITSGNPDILRTFKEQLAGLDCKITKEEADEYAWELTISGSVELIQRIHQYVKRCFQPKDASPVFLN